MFASEYGYTLEQYSAMTPREVVECSKRIVARRDAEYRFNANIHGAKLEEKKIVDAKPLSDKEKKFAESSMERMVREKQEEIAKKNQRISRGK